MKRKNDFMMQNIGGERLLVPLGARVVDMNGLVTMNETAAFLWEMLEQDRTAEEMAADMAGRFEVNGATALADVSHFTEELSGMGLLEK